MMTGTAAPPSKNESVSRRGIILAAIDGRLIDIDFCAAILSRTDSLIGSNLAIFTFVLVFLFPRYDSTQLNGALFQATLTTSLLAVFLFIITGISFFEVIAFAMLSVEKRRALIYRENSLFVLGLMFSRAMPSIHDAFED